LIPCLARFGLVENFVAIFGQLIDFGLQFVYAVYIPAPQRLGLLRMQLSQAVVHI
jgi:hypothetical protein